MSNRPSSLVDDRELCERVASIYGYLYRKLVDACTNRDTDAIDDALRVLRIERETWQMLVDKVNKARQAVDTDQDEPVEQTAETPLTFSAKA